MTIAITTLGLKKKIVFGDDSDDVYVDGSDIDLNYNSSSNTISLRVKDASRFTSYGAIPIANVTIGGVLITDQSVFDTQLAAVFPNEGGGSDTPTLDQVLAVVPNTLTEDRTIDLNSFTLSIINGVANLLQINHASFQSVLNAYDGTSQSSIKVAADTGDSNVRVTMQTESGGNDVRVVLNALAALITLSGGDVIIAGLAGGGTTGLSIDNDGKIIRTP